MPPKGEPLAEAFNIEVLPLYVGKDGKQRFLIDDALAVLLADGDVFINTDKDGRLVLYMNCNDVFAWACADGEPLEYSEIEAFYRASRDKWGSTKWVCVKRNQQPQPPIVRDMKKEGAWDDVMEALPANTMDAEAQAIFAQVAREHHRT